ncbi:MAG TPA: LamG domain-containing protein, partial [Candidatus Woesebacteria bacterium]|nr:LamG domain-containing protein [Candidatus Woesebacteria bacterium]
NSGNGGSNYNLNLSAIQSTWVDGKINKAIGVSQATITAGSTIAVANEVTFSGWIYPKSFDGNSKGIIGLKNYTPYWGYCLNLASSVLEFRFQDTGGTWRSTNSASYFGVGNTNTWTYVAVTHNGSITKFYINGKFFSQSSLAYTSGGTVGNTIALGNVGWNDFLGNYDEMKIYNYALTDEEIKLDYNQGSQFVMGQSNQTIGGTTTSLEYCLPGDTSYCAPPIAEYKFDENIGTTAYDTSGNNRNLLINGGTWAPGPNNKGSSIKLGQDQYASNDWTDFTLNNQTIEFWFKANQLTGAYQDLVGTHFNSDMNRFHLNSGTNAIIWYNAVSGSSVNSNVVPTANQWYHVAGTYDGTDRKIYVNGALKNTSTSVGLTDTATGLYVGGTTEDFYGNLSGIKIYNYARTPAQVAWDYNKGKPIGWWKFDECQGNIAYDSSGIGNTGIINIGPSGSQVQLGTCSAGDTSAWANGKTGKLDSAMSFDGSDDRITLGNPSSLQVAGTKDFSVAAWIYATQNKCGREAVDKSSNTLCGTATNGGWVLGGTTGTLGFHVSDHTNLQYKYLSFSSQLNTWYHLVGVRKGNAVVLYRNGVQIATDDITGFVIDDNKNFSIGGNTTAWIWPGLIDDVRIYNYALTSEQVKQVYNDGAVNFN